MLKSSRVLGGLWSVGVAGMGEERRGKGRIYWRICTGLSMDSIEFQTLRDLQTFNIKQINQLCRRIIPLG